MEPCRRKRRKNVTSKPVGYICINKLMNRVIGWVMTKARARDRARSWGSDNRERQNQTSSRWKKNNREKHLADTKKYNDAHKADALDYQKKKRSDDEAFAIKCRCGLVLHVGSPVLVHQKHGSTFDMIGCSPNQLQTVFHISRVDFSTL